MTVASRNWQRYCCMYFTLVGLAVQLSVPKEKTLPSLVWSYLHLIQLRFDSINYRHHTTIACTTQGYMPLKVIVWLQNKIFLTYIRLLAFADKLCTSSGVKLLLLVPDWLPTTTGFCCETLHQFWCETFTGDCPSDYLRLLAIPGKLCTSSGVKLLLWLPERLPATSGFCCKTLHQFWCKTLTMIADWLPTTSGFCCETLHQFRCETFTVIVWLTA